MVEIDKEMNEFSILSMQFSCNYPLEESLLRECQVSTTVRNNSYFTSNVLLDDKTSLDDAVYTMYRSYRKVIEAVKCQQGTVCLYITHHTLKESPLEFSKDLLKFLSEKEINVGVD